MKPKTLAYMANAVGIRASRTLPVTLLTTTFLVISFTSRVAAQEKKVPVPASQLPSAVKKAVVDAFPNAKILRVEREVEGENPGQHDVILLSEEEEYEVEISAEGQVIESKKRVPVANDAGDEQAKKWTQPFHEQDCTFSSVGKNRFFILEPGYQLVLQSRSEKVVITVLDETKTIGNVETRVVEEREEEDGKLKEVSRNFFAICKEHGNVFYFGEEVDDYEDGKVVGHSGAWRADNEKSQAGIIMPGTILLGSRHYQEIAPNAQDRAEILRDDVTMTTPAGTFTNCIRIEETSGIDANDRCHKTYAPGVGIIQDEDLVLVKYSHAR